MNRKDRGALIGMILGDGYIQKTNNPSRAHFGLKVEHSGKQEDYAIFKSKIVHSIFGGKESRLYRRERFDKRTGKIYSQIAFYKGHKYFRILRRLLYPDNKKTYTRRILDYLTPEGIAYWYMDDGYIKSYRNKNKDRVTSCQTYLATYCPRDEAEIIRDYFKEVWGIEFSIHTRKKNGSCTLCANTQASREFVGLISPYIIESMKYKISHLPEFNN